MNCYEAEGRENVISLNMEVLQVGQNVTDEVSDHHLVDP